MTASNVGLNSSTVNAEDRIRGENIIEMDLRAFGRVLIGYSLIIVAPLFAVSTFKFGIKATLWGLAIFHFSCFLEVLAVWWQEERQWSRVGWSSYPGSITLPQVQDAGRKSNR